MQLYSPWVLVLLVFVPFVWFLSRRHGAWASLRFSSLHNAVALRHSWRVRLRGLLITARIGCIILLIVALARPQRGSSFHKVSTKGVAMELVVDRSGSMAGQMSYKGRQMSRLDVVKEVLSDFVRGGRELQGRQSDLLGLVAFARYADTLCPLVHAHDALLGFLDQTKVAAERSKENATAIGDAIALAAARLKNAEEEITSRNAKLEAATSADQPEGIKPEFEIQSKALILLTDGRQNAGRYTPMEAAQLAGDWGIKIYTIGIGAGESGGRMSSPFGNFLAPFGRELDEGLLRQIAELTGGFYSRAGDGEALRRVCEKIDQQEKSEIESVQYSRYEERFSPWTIAALIVLVLEIVMSCTIFRKIP